MNLTTDIKSIIDKIDDLDNFILKIALSEVMYIDKKANHHDLVSTITGLTDVDLFFKNGFKTTLSQVTFYDHIDGIYKNFTDYQALIKKYINADQDYLFSSQEETFEVLHHKIKLAKYLKLNSFILEFNDISKYHYEDFKYFLSDLRLDFKSQYTQFDTTLEVARDDSSYVKIEIYL